MVESRMQQITSDDDEAQYRDAEGHRTYSGRLQEKFVSEIPFDRRHLLTRTLTLEHYPLQYFQL